MDYSNTKKKTIIDLPNGRCRVEWKGGHKVFINREFAELYVMKCEEYKIHKQLMYANTFDNGIMVFNDTFGIGEETVYRNGSHLETIFIETDLDFDD